MSKKTLPVLQSDEEAERFVEEADLSEYDLSGGMRVRFEFESETAHIEVRLPEAQLALVKAEAKKRGMPYQRFIRVLIERGLRDLESV